MHWHRPNSDEQLAVQAVDLVHGGQLPNLRADLLVVLADILRARRLEGSEEAVGQAVRLYRLKRNLASGKTLA